MFKRFWIARVYQNRYTSVAAACDYWDLRRLLRPLQGLQPDRGEIQQLHLAPRFKRSFEKGQAQVYRMSQQRSTMVH
jgi:hypothetical protein